jgi:hypothetical protein
MFLTEAAEVLERVVRREVLELHEQIGEEFLYGVHELVHELFHLCSRDSVFEPAKGGITYLLRRRARAAYTNVQRIIEVSFCRCTQVEANR